MKVLAGRRRIFGGPEQNAAPIDAAALGRMRIPGDDVGHFNRPTDVAWDRDDNIYVTDGYGNLRVLKLDKHGNKLLGWGMKGTGPGQFDTPHTIVIDNWLRFGLSLTC
jgi:DNA-binding beta-propeller fold protein YncE